MAFLSGEYTTAYNLTSSCIALYKSLDMLNLQIDLTRMS